MRKVFLLIIFYSSLIFCTAQSSQIDSLVKSLKTQKVDSCIYNTCIKIAENYKDSAFDKSLFYYNQALEAVERTHQRKKVADVYHSIGYIYMSKGEFPSALSNLNNALKILEFINDKEGIGQILNDIGLIYKTWGKYEKANENFHKALMIFDETGNEKFIAVVSNNIGQIYYYRNEFEKAIPYFTKYLEVNKRDRNPRAVAGAANNIASAYLELGKLDEALDYYKKSMKIYDSLGIKVGVAVIKDNIGSLYIRKKQYNDALIFSIEASKIFEELGSQSRLCASLHNVGLAYSKLNQPNMAIKFLSQGLEIAIKLKQLETQKNIYEALSEVYTLKKEFGEALTNYKLYSELKDSLLNSETIGKIETIQTEYESQKKEKELADVNQKYKSQKLLGLLSIGLIILFLFLTSLIIRENQNKKNIIIKSNNQLNNIYLVIEKINKNNLITPKELADTKAFFEKYWLITSSEESNLFFIPFYKKTILYYAFISNGSNYENLAILKLAISDFFNSSHSLTFDFSIKEHFSEFISKDETWCLFNFEKQLLNVDFWCFNRENNQHFYSGTISAFHVNERNQISDLSQNANVLLDLKKDDRLFFCASNSLNSFILNEQNPIQNTLKKTLERSINLKFEQQKEILENSLELIEAGNGQKVRISILAIQI